MEARSWLRTRYATPWGKAIFARKLRFSRRVQKTYGNNPCVQKIILDSGDDQSDCHLDNDWRMHRRFQIIQKNIVQSEEFLFPCKGKDRLTQTGIFNKSSIVFLLHFLFQMSNLDKILESEEGMEWDPEQDNILLADDEEREMEAGRGGLPRTPPNNSPVVTTTTTLATITSAASNLAITDQETATTTATTAATPSSHSTTVSETGHRTRSNTSKKEERRRALEAMSEEEKKEYRRIRNKKENERKKRKNAEKRKEMERQKEGDGTGRDGTENEGKEIGKEKEIRGEGSKMDNQVPRFSGAATPSGGSFSRTPRVRILNPKPETVDRRGRANQPVPRATVETPVSTKRKAPPTPGSATPEVKEPNPKRPNNVPSTSTSIDPSNITSQGQSELCGGRVHVTLNNDPDWSPPTRGEWDHLTKELMEKMDIAIVEQGVPLHISFGFRTGASEGGSIEAKDGISLEWLIRTYPSLNEEGYYRFWGPGEEPPKVPMIKIVGWVSGYNPKHFIRYLQVQNATHNLTRWSIDTAGNEVEGITWVRLLVDQRSFEELSTCRDDRRRRAREGERELWYRAGMVRFAPELPRPRSNSRPRSEGNGPGKTGR